VKPIDTREDFFGVWSVYWPIALGVFVTVALLLLFLGIRYRSRSREFPEGRDKNEALEGGYALVLACVAAFLIFLTYSRMPGKADSAAAGPPLKVTVTGARWNWRFEYPEYGIVEQGSKGHIPVLRVPVGRPVEFSGSSIDVIHSFWIPEERFKRDLFPGIDTRWEMVFERVANWPGGGVCAEFCGLEHSDMVFDVLAMPVAEFEGWAGGRA
jgi:cytochrome c oxidase subunit II